jgi:hypothetical protein
VLGMDPLLWPRPEGFGFASGKSGYTTPARGATPEFKTSQKDRQ